MTKVLYESIIRTDEVKVNSRVEIMKRRQEKEGLTNEQFAVLLGVSRDAWVKVKAGIRNPGLKLLDPFNQQFPDERIFDSGVSRPPQKTQNGYWGVFKRVAGYFTFGFYKG